MTKNEIILKVKTLNLPPDSYVVFGSCPMALVGLREARDIDLVVSPEVFARLKTAGWKVVKKDGKDDWLARDVFEAHNERDFLQTLLSSATMADGVPFASLQNLKKWKQDFGREKDLADIKLIDGYLAEHKI